MVVERFHPIMNDGRMFPPDYEIHLRREILRLENETRKEWKRVDPKKLRLGLGKQIAQDYPEADPAEIEQKLNMIWSSLMKPTASKIQSNSSPTAQDIHRSARRAQVKALKGRR
jgi:hypothetical protein